MLGRIESLFSLDALGQVLSLADLGGAGAVCGLYKQLFQNFTEDSDPGEGTNLALWFISVGQFVVKKPDLTETKILSYGELS